MDKLFENNKISRRQLLQYLAAMSTGIALPLSFTGCAVDPVSGKKELMMVSRQQEIGIDKQQSPFQFSSDYGITRDKKINSYVSQVGKTLIPNVHRPDMPYNFQCVNATYINAYAFPGGSIAVTRGILLKLDNEAELASLLGHELGHVNARHSAEQMTKGQFSSILVSGLSIAAGNQGAGLGQLTQQLGMLSQSLLLSKYSRDNEREADSLGNQYMVKAGFSTKGFVGLMKMLQSLHEKQTNTAQILFSTHPMSSERLNSAVKREKGMYHSSTKHPLNREKYMDSIASLRGKKQGIELLQQGEKYLGEKEYDKARSAFKKSIKKLKYDYTAYVLMSKCLMVMERPLQALSYAESAKRLYPEEAQALYIAGIANKELKKYNKAFKDFNKCDTVLPGNPQIKFYKGYCLDKLNQKQVAADNYKAYLKMVNYKSNKYSQYAYKRLQKWGYVK